MEINIKGCSDCPLCKNDFDLGYYCGHPKLEDFFFSIYLDEENNPITPDFCPLDYSPLLLRKKAWQVFQNFWNKEN